jgi:hypothetical protein
MDSARLPRSDPRPELNPWQEYVRRKRQWELENPKASPEQHTQAIRRIAEELGV